ncbi:MAG: SsrA-binding protein SmpB, partial [Malacoplasma sp.]
MKLIVQNKKAHFNYNLLESYEVGIELKGVEVKSIQKGNVSINEAYVFFKKNEAFIINMNISPYDHGNIHNVNPIRERKLLLHKKEIIKLQHIAKKDSLTIIPYKIYWKHNKIKLLIYLAKGKKLFDKR